MYKLYLSYQGDKQHISIIYIHSILSHTEYYNYATKISYSIKQYLEND